MENIQEEYPKAEEFWYGEDENGNYWLTLDPAVGSYPGDIYLGCEEVRDKEFIELCEKAG